MPRPLRLQVAGGVFHVVSRGNRQQPIYWDEIDRERFLELWAAMLERQRWKCHGYCLMPNHYHAMIETPMGDLSAGMHWINFRYAAWFNNRRDLSGHLFQGRFHSELVDTQQYLLELTRYIVLNPVRAGLCRRAEDWRWSSYQSVLGSGHDTFLTVDWLLLQFGPDLDRARQRYARFVAEGARLARAA